MSSVDFPAECPSVECCPEDPFEYQIQEPAASYIAGEGTQEPIIGEGGGILIPE